jgi:hypothetical protein
VYRDVRTAYNSPFYGGTYVWGGDFGPAHARRVNYVLGVKETLFFEKLDFAMSTSPTCKNGAVKVLRRNGNKKMENPNRDHNTTRKTYKI